MTKEIKQKVRIDLKDIDDYNGYISTIDETADGWDERNEDGFIDRHAEIVGVDGFLEFELIITISLFEWGVEKISFYTDKALLYLEEVERYKGIESTKVKEFKFDKIKFSIDELPLSFIFKAEIKENDEVVIYTEL